MKFFALVLLSCLINLFAYAETEMIIRGALIAAPCLIVTDSEEQNVEFGSITTKTFVQNDRTLPKNFSIKLKECDVTVMNVVQVLFDGERDADIRNGFAIKGDAQGLAIIIEDSMGREAVPGVAGNEQPLIDENNVLHYKAYVQAKNYAAIKEGYFESVVMFSIIYN